VIGRVRFELLAAAAAVLGAWLPAAAHPVPFSYLDVHNEPGAIEVALVAHVFDVGHELAVEPPEQLLDTSVLAAKSDAIVALIRGRLRIEADGRALSESTWAPPEALPDRQSLRLRATFPLTKPAGSVAVVTALFPYDPKHQTFVNFFDGAALVSQSMIDISQQRTEHFSGTRQGWWAVVRRFAAAGSHHILTGPDHLLFLVGLLLLGGGIRRLLLIATAFTAAQTLTGVLAATKLLIIPASITEPAIALGIIYTGADNLLVRGGRDMRVWISLGFGLLHGFGFGRVLSQMDLVGRGVGWAVFSFNIGVEAGQLILVAVVASLLALLHLHSEAASRRLALAGSVFVMAAGAFWFVQRMFFPGGIT
jgi:hypothetical protein